MKAVFVPQNLCVGFDITSVLMTHRCRRSQNRREEERGLTLRIAVSRAGFTARRECRRPAARTQMVERQLVRRGVHDQRVLRAMRDVPREAFVEAGMEEFAFDDLPLPIGEGQTISQPYIVAFMAEAAELSPNDKVLEVGTGFGYAAAVFGRIARGRLHDRAVSFACGNREATACPRGHQERVRAGR